MDGLHKNHSQHVKELFFECMPLPQWHYCSISNFDIMLDMDSIVDSALQHQHEIVPVAAGVTAFWSVCAISCWMQLRVLLISTGSPRLLVATPLGMATVCTGALCSHAVAVGTHESVRTRTWPRLHQVGYWRTMQRACVGRETFSIGGKDGFKIPAHTLRICAVGLVAFKLLGGRFWAIAPSSFTHAGSFSRISLPATEAYATTSQRAALERLGRRFGCHTCGSRQYSILNRSSGARFVGDHIPPKSVMAQKLKKNRWTLPSVWRHVTKHSPSYRFYPQCTSCSQRQGSLLSAATLSKRASNLSHVGAGKNAHSHGSRLRASHMAGGVTAAGAVWSNDGGGSRHRLSEQRYADWQAYVTSVALAQGRRVQAMWSQATPQ